MKAWKKQTTTPIRPDLEPLRAALLAGDAYELAHQHEHILESLKTKGLALPAPGEKLYSSLRLLPGVVFVTFVCACCDDLKTMAFSSEGAAKRYFRGTSQNAMKHAASFGKPS